MQLARESDDAPPDVRLARYLGVLDVQGAEVPELPVEPEFVPDAPAIVPEWVEDDAPTVHQLEDDLPALPVLLIEPDVLIAPPALAPDPIPYARPVFDLGAQEEAVIFSPSIDIAPDMPAARPFVPLRGDEDGEVFTADADLPVQPAAPATAPAAAKGHLVLGLVLVIGAFVAWLIFGER